MDTTDFGDKTIVERYQKYLLVNKYFGKPAFMNFIDEIHGLNILDLGCGTGHFSRDLTKMGGICTGIDKSNKSIEIAKGIEGKKKLGIKYYCLNGANLEGIKSNFFDKVIIFQVLMNVPKENEIKNIFNEVKRVLKIHGEIIFSIFHPSLIRNYRDNLREIILPKDYNYFNNSINYKAKHLLTDFSWMEFKNTHWTLEFIFKILRANNFIITGIKEPMPKKDKFWKYFKNITKVPHYMFIKAIR